MSRLRDLSILCLPILFTAACSGGGGGGAPANPAAPSSVQLLLDPATGSDAFVEVQVAAAALQRPDGSFTGNLLPADVMLTIADPTGEPQGLLLPAVPAGTYRELHLMLVPGSASAVLQDGSRAGVDFASADLGIHFDVDVVHDGQASTWVAARHLGAASLQPGGNGRIVWMPQLGGGSAAGTPVSDATLRVLMVQNGTVVGGFAGTDDHGVHLEFEHGVELFDDHGQHVGDPAAFLGGLGAGSELCVSGMFDDHGGLRGQRVRHCFDDRGGSGPRLLGRITDLDAVGGTFGMDVLAQTHHGERSFVGAPEHVVVHVGSASIHFSHTWAVLGFGDLLQGDLVKVRWSLRNGSDLTASEIEVESHGGMAASPEIEGRVSEVQLANQVIVVVPRGNDPLLVQGRAVARAEIHVGAATRIERHESGSHTAIGLGDIVANGDRIWIRGTATGPDTVDADWIRVRHD